MPRSKLPPVYENLRLAIYDLGFHSSAARENYIRRRLRLCPKWIDGHTVLAETIVRRGIKGERPLDTKELSSLRISCEAAKTLLGADAQALPQQGAERGRKLEEAELWSAFLEFFQRRHSEALFRFQVVLEEKNVVHLSRDHHHLALEYGAAAAVALGKDPEAKKFLADIPEKFRTRDVKLMCEAFSRG